MQRIPTLKLLQYISYILDPDAFDDDGVYSGYIFPKCLENGRVNIKILVSGDKGMTKISKKVIGAAPIIEGNLHLRCVRIFLLFTCKGLLFA